MKEHGAADNHTKRGGQAMLLTVLALGGAILGATTIAGVLMLYQIRSTTDAAHSAQAIFAADAGIGWAEYDRYCGYAGTCVNPGGEQPMPVFAASSDASVTVSCYDPNNSVVACGTTSTPTSAIAKGQSLTSVRAFLLDLGNATSALP